MGRPSRSKAIVNCSFGLVRTLAANDSQFARGVLLMETRRSPGRNPPSAAGEVGSTQPTTGSEERYLGCWTPIMNTAGKTKSARTRFMTGPAPTIAVRLITDCSVKDRLLSESGTSSSGDSPSSFTYPPRGMRAIWYSVSPRFWPMSFFPKPKENFKTPTPNPLATAKCPSSWMNTRMPRPMIPPRI